MCTHPFEVNGKEKIVLPQGSPTSPTITNVLCYELDKHLFQLAKKYNAKYSRYADDITFSCDSNIFKSDNRELSFIKKISSFIKKTILPKTALKQLTFSKELKQIIQKQGLKINPKKTRLQSNLFRQEVTGLIVNEKINVRRKYIKNLRMWISYWEKYGLSKAEELYHLDFKKNTNYYPNRMMKTYFGNINNSTLPSFKQSIDGKLNFLSMVKGKSDPTYIKLRSEI